MSQRGSASLPVSRASSQSPRTVPPSSSARATYPVPSGHEVPHNPDRSPLRVVSGDGDRLTAKGSRLPEPRRVILNPFVSGVEGSGSDSPPRDPRSGSEPPPMPSGHGRVLSGPSATATHYQQEQQPSSLEYYHRSSLGANVPTASPPQTDRSHLGVLGLDRASPTAVNPPAALENPRTGPASQLSRARSMHYPITREAEGSYIPSVLPSLAGTKRPFEGDAGHRVTSPPARPLQPSYSGPLETPTTLLPAASMLRNTPSRSFSQPVHPGGYQQSTPVPPRAWPQHHHPSQPQAGWEQGSVYGASPLPAVREPQALTSAARAPLSAPGTPSVPGSGLNVPEAGLISYTIDMTSGSAAQTKKRKKNAEASSRHRKGKKAEKQQLEHEVASLRRQLGGTQQDCDAYRSEAHAYRRALEFYKRERDRLRDVVLRTPTISEAARGPPSPQLPTQMAHAAMFSEETAPHHLPGPPPSVHPTAQATYPTGQALDAAEREPGSRRPDRTPDVRGIPYGQRSQQHRQTPTHEPPQPSVGLPHAMPSPRQDLAAYAMPLSRPASASSTEMLPPLRSIGGAAMETGAPQAQRQHYGSRATYETGFLHAPREQPREVPRESEGGWSHR